METYFYLSVAASLLMPIIAAQYFVKPSAPTGDCAISMAIVFLVLRAGTWLNGLVASAFMIGKNQWLGVIATLLYVSVFLLPALLLFH
jgi:hypothetical protein